MNIPQFIDSFSDLVRANRFRVQFSHEIKIGGSASSAVTSGDPTKAIGTTLTPVMANKLCKATSFPFWTYSVSEMNYNSRAYKFPTKHDLDSVSFSFYMDTDYQVLQYFTYWMAEIRVPGEDYYTYKKNYCDTIRITSLDASYNTPIATAILKNAYPTNINTIDYSFDSRDTLTELTVAFNFDDVTYEYGK
jgi:hypothetical protein